MEKIYYSADDLIGLLGISRSKAYQMIRSLNAELEANNYITIPGKVSRAYFNAVSYTHLTLPTNREV